MFGSSAEAYAGASPDGPRWAAAFVAHGGVKQLLALLLPPPGTPDLLDNTRGSQRKPCLVLLLKLVWRAVDDPDARVQGLAVGLAEHHATARGNQKSLPMRQILDDRLFFVAKRRLSMRLEKSADRHADASLQLGVRIHEPQAEVPSQVPPHRGLAAAGHADEG